MKELAFQKVLIHPIWNFEAIVTSIQNLGAKDGVRERVKIRLWSFTNLLKIYKRDFVGVSYIFLLIIVGEVDPIGFFWFLCWYLIHVIGIVAGSCWCCPILYLWIDFMFIDILWWWGQINGWRDHIYALSGWCYWTCGDLEVTTGKMHNLMVM